MGIETAILAVAAVGTAASIQQSRQSRKASKRAARAQRRISQRENQRERIRQLRESQIARAQITAGAAQTGTLSTSAFEGGVASIGSQAAGNISFINQIESLQQQIHKNQQRAADFSANAQGIQAITNLGVQAAGMMGGSSTSTAAIKSSSQSSFIPAGHTGRGGI